MCNIKERAICCPNYTLWCQDVVFQFQPCSRCYIILQAQTKTKIDRSLTSLPCNDLHTRINECNIKSHFLLSHSLSLFPNKYMQTICWQGCRSMICPGLLFNITSSTTRHIVQLWTLTASQNNEQISNSHTHSRWSCRNQAKCPYTYNTEISSQQQYLTKMYPQNNKDICTCIQDFSIMKQNNNHSSIYTHSGQSHAHIWDLTWHVLKWTRSVSREHHSIAKRKKLPGLTSANLGVHLRWCGCECCAKLAITHTQRDLSPLWGNQSPASSTWCYTHTV